GAAPACGAAGQVGARRMVAPRSGPARLSLAREALGVVQVEAADFLLLAVAELRPPAAGVVAPQAGDEVAPDDRGAVEADEEGGVELVFELADRVVDQPAPPAHMEPHIVALGADPVDLGGGKADQAARLRHPEFLEMRRPLRRWCALRLAPVLEPPARPLDRAGEALGGDRLHHIVD